MLKYIPNIITVSRLLLLPIIVYLLWENPSLKESYIAAGVLFIIGVSDLLDGWFARKFNAVTNIGKTIDPTADKITILVSIIMLLNLNRINVILAILILSREILVTTLRAVASSEGVIMPATTSAKRKTALQMFGVGGLFIYYDFFGASASYCGHFLLTLSVIMAWISAIKYFNRFLKKTS
jgi:CDP-diacylglycerol---glycerol-3-phosphate 3-phosphatidyltransferase